MQSEREILAALEAARGELATQRLDLEQTVAAMQAQPLLSDEERKALEEQAASGALGEDMATLVAKIRDGEDTWEAVFAGESPHGALLQGHLTSIVEEHAEDIQLAWEDFLDEEEAKGNYVL